MKNFIWLLIFLLGSFVSFGQSQKTLIKSFNVNVDEVTINIDCPKTIYSWDKPYIKVELSVTTNFKAEIMDILVKNGRYKLESSFENNKLVVSLPNLKNKMKIGDVDLIESFKIKVWIPNYSEVKSTISL